MQRYEEGESEWLGSAHPTAEAVCTIEILRCFHFTFSLFVDFFEARNHVAYDCLQVLQGSSESAARWEGGLVTSGVTLFQGEEKCASRR